MSDKFASEIDFLSYAMGMNMGEYLTRTPIEVNTQAALDGGRAFLLLVNTVFTAITKKKIPSKYEGYIHAAGMILLLAFMAFITFKDIWKLVH